MKDTTLHSIATRPDLTTTSGSLSTNTPSATATKNMNISNHNGTSTPESYGLPSTLVHSLTGPLQPRYYLFTNGYPGHAEHSDPAVKNMVINQKSITNDIHGLLYWVKQRDLETKTPYKLYCDWKGYTPAKMSRIRTAMETPRKHPTFIYLAGHTESITSATQPPQLTYAPADYLPASSAAQPQVIPYETMRQWLSNDLHSKPLVLVTEVCYCENFFCLPFELDYDGSEARWRKTDYYSSFEGKSSDIVHFAATSPGESSACFSTTGAIFTKAFCFIKPNEPLALKDIAGKLQKNVDTILSQSAEQNPQHPKIYSSRIINDPHFYAALGFCSSNPTVETDSDSSG